MKIDELKKLLASGNFDHATYRNQGTLWEGLWIYKKSERLRGFEPAGCFRAGECATPEERAMEKEAYELVRHSGVSLGSYGNG